MLKNRRIYLFILAIFLLLFFFYIAFFGTFLTKKSISTPEIIYGGIVPHHLLVNFIIDDFFKGLSKQNIKTIILIGPNHKEKGGKVALSSYWEWDTKFGKLSANKEIINDLLERAVVRIDEKIVAEEISISALIGIIKSNLPEAKIVPIILSQKMKEEEIIRLAKSLSFYITRETIVVSSVDFSHYLLNSEAEKKDEITLQVLRDFDYKTILRLDSDYLDSPQAISCLLLIMKQLGTNDIKILDHTNSGELLNNDKIQTTSYFSIYFLKEGKLQ